MSPWELTPGKELESAVVNGLHECSRALEARLKAVELLARRAHSAEEVRRKLRLRSFDTRHIDEALAWLDQRGYLNDRAFAGEWVERRVERHPEGRLALIAGLRRRGISREVAEEVTAALCTPESERARAEAALAGLSRHGESPEPSEERIRRALQRRGFGASLVLELLRERRRGGGGEGAESG